MRLKMLACDIFHREMEEAVSKSRNSIDLEFLPQGLHKEGAAMVKKLQEAVDYSSLGKYDAILMGYALCGNGLLGLAARGTRLIIPRAHDCIALFFGSRARYMDYFNSHPGVYYKTSGWMERVDGGDCGCGDGCCSGDQLTLGSGPGMTVNYDELVVKFGEEDAKYVMEELSSHERNYNQITFIEMGVEPSDELEKRARADAEKSGWKFEKVRGDMSLLQRLADGPWDGPDFLVVPPSWRVAAKYDEDIMKAVPPEDAGG